MLQNVAKQAVKSNSKSQLITQLRSRSKSVERKKSEPKEGAEKAAQKTAIPTRAVEKTAPQSETAATTMPGTSRRAPAGLDTIGSTPTRVKSEYILNNGSGIHSFYVLENQ
ncbi:unnamed protein product [Caenorhabditis auriculariae]|uniref:Uncharacterized protein n=1 Tax=Caenorhabditis auriculariae TaxID=2777116 RepID=A0A8S1HQ72_9PELO|nr:unnamed protein product [Caenorhabditis auriculariae]